MNLWQLVRERLIQPLARAQGSPSSIARGAALGTWIAFTPTVGVQMFLVTVLSLPLRANIAIGIALVWISNPVTVIPMYYSYYWLGTIVLGIETRGYRALAKVFTEQIRALGSQGVLRSLEVVGAEVLWPLLVGSVIIATVLAIPAYQIGLRMAARRRARMLREQARALDVQEAAAAPPPVIVRGADGELPRPPADARQAPADGPAVPPPANLSETSPS